MSLINYDDVMIELSKRDYAEYVEYVHNDMYKHGKITRYLCKTVQEFIEKKTDKAYEILILSMPPQHSKSMTITETLPSWYLGMNPKHRVIEVSYNDDFAKKFIRKNREKIQNYGNKIFGIEIGYPNTSNEFILSNTIGSMQSRGIGSGITGNPAELVIIDDPVKNAKEAYSETVRESIFEEWQSSIKSRLAPKAKIIVIMTRWHKDDLAGKILQTERNVTLLNFPVECTEELDVIGRKRGDPLFPEIGKDKEWLEDYKIAYQTAEGSKSWNSLFMGSPTSEEGNIFKREWFRYYTGTPEVYFTAISVDATFKDNPDNDRVSIQVWGKAKSKYYLLYRVSKIMGFVDTLRSITEVISMYSDYNAIYIEEKANGAAIIDVLSRKYVGVVPINPEGGKVARANAIQAIFESGNVYIHKDKHIDFENELCNFPYDDHDDDVDACSQLLTKTKNFVAEPPPKHDPDELDMYDQINELIGFGT